LEHSWCLGEKESKKNSVGLVIKKTCWNSDWSKSPVGRENLPFDWENVPFHFSKSYRLKRPSSDSLTALQGIFKDFSRHVPRLVWEG
jgi:hypothetical protein